MTPIPEMTDTEVLEAIRITRSHAWISKFHREHLAQLEEDKRYHDAEIARMALAAGADLRLTNRFGGTALIPACHYGHVETVRELLRTKIDVDHVNRLGWTALLEAIILGDGGPAHTEIVRLALAAGALLLRRQAGQAAPRPAISKRGSLSASSKRSPT